MIILIPPIFTCITFHNSFGVSSGCRATHGVKSGSFYFEATISGTGVARIGYATMQAALELGRDAQGFGYGGTGMKSHKNSFEAYGTKYGDGKVGVMCLRRMLLLQAGTPNSMRKVEYFVRLFA